MNDSLLKFTDDILNKIHIQGGVEDADQWPYLFLPQEEYILLRKLVGVCEVIDQYIVAAQQGE